MKLSDEAKNELVSAGIKQGIPLLVDLIGAVIALFTRMPESAASPAGGDSSLAVAVRIVQGIAKSHPDWPSDEKARYARDAIRAHLGPDVPESNVRALHELAVQQIKAA